MALTQAYVHRLAVATTTVFGFLFINFFLKFLSHAGSRTEIKKNATNLSVKALIRLNASECHDICLDLKSVQTHLVQTLRNKQSQQGQQVRPRWKSVITAEIRCTSNAHPNTRVTSEMRGLANSAKYPSTYWWVLPLAGWPRLPLSMYVGMQSEVTLQHYKILHVFVLTIPLLHNALKYWHWAGHGVGGGGWAEH